MLKSQTATKKQNWFTLACYHSSCTCKTVEVDFNPPLSLNKSSNSITPSFCRDRRHYTPAFILPRDRDYYEANHVFERAHFESKVIKAVCQIEGVEGEGADLADRANLVPQANYCQICKQPFTSYFEHLAEQHHRDLSHQATANTFINDLCLRYSRRRRVTGKQTKSKAITRKQKPTHSQDLNPIPRARLRRRRNYLPDKNISQSVNGLAATSLCL